MRIVVEREIPSFKGYWARNDGTVTKTCGVNTRGCLHKQIDRHEVKIEYKKYLVNRLIASAWVENPRPDFFFLVDHKDRNTHNNQPENLRSVTYFTDG